MTYRQIDNILQWVGTALILIGHMLTAAGPGTWPYNVFCFFLGSSLFMIWAVRVKIPAQVVVNAASILIAGSGTINGIVALLQH